MVGGFFRPRVASVRIHCNRGPVGGYIIHSSEVLQDIFSFQCAALALSAVGNFCSRSEFVYMVVEPIGRNCNPRRSIQRVFLK